MISRLYIQKDLEEFNSKNSPSYSSKINLERKINQALMLKSASTKRFNLPLVKEMVSEVEGDDDKKKIVKGLSHLKSYYDQNEFGMTKSATVLKVKKFDTFSFSETPSRTELEIEDTSIKEDIHDIEEEKNQKGGWVDEVDLMKKKENKLPISFSDIIQEDVLENPPNEEKIKLLEIAKQKLNEEKERFKKILRTEVEDECTPIIKENVFVVENIPIEECEEEEK